MNISRAYQSPPTFLNYLNWRDATGKGFQPGHYARRLHARRSQVDLFGRHVNQKLDSVKRYLPDDLIMVHTSDQPVQVNEQIDLFMDALYEAIGLASIKYRFQSSPMPVREEARWSRK